MKTVISLLALAAAVPAIAQTADPADDIIVVTASGIAQSQDQVGQAITVIDPATIERRQAVNVTDLLITTPGIRYNRNGPIGGVAGVSIRGAETTQTLVLIDGVKVNDPAGIGDQYDFGALLTGNLRRIEILRGSNSVVHGSQAIGGVINLSTGTPFDGLGGSASAEYGYRDTLNLKGDVAGSSGMVSGGVGAAYFRTDGISAKSNNNERDPYENLSANARLKLAFSEQISLDLRGYYIKSDLDFDGFSTPFLDVNKSDQYVGYAGLNVALFDGMFDSRAAVTYLRNDRTDYYSREVSPISGFRARTLRFEYQGVIEPIERVRLLFGYEHEKPEYLGFDYYSGPVTRSRQRANIDNVYALAIVQPLSGLSLTGGARYSDHSQFGDAITIGANANYSPNGGATNLRAAYGEGFKAPSLYQLYAPFVRNPNLKPERSQSYDIGIDQNFLGDAAVISVTAFQRDIKNQIDFDSSFTYNNIANTRAKGVEAALSLRPVEALTFVASYSYIDARDRSGRAGLHGKRLARRAEDSVSVSIDYDWSFGISTGATVTVVGDSFNDPRNTTRIDGHVVAGIRASFAIMENLELYGRVDNLFDEDYETVTGYNNFRRAAYGGVRARF